MTDRDLKVLLGTKIERLADAIDQCGGNSELQRELTDLLDQCTQVLMLDTLERPAPRLLN